MWSLTRIKSFTQRVWFVISLAALANAQSAMTTVDNLPSFDSNNGVDFYYCESSFPFNAPINIVYVAGIHAI
jgi:hypothetical protein